MLMQPKVPCVITKSGETDMYGQEVLGVSVRTKCGVVRLDASSIKTSVRADSSASRGNASEVIASARLLFSPKENVEIGDKIDVSGVELKAVGVFPRHTIVGVLDHIQVDAEAWA